MDGAAKWFSLNQIRCEICEIPPEIGAFLKHFIISKDLQTVVSFASGAFPTLNLGLIT